MMDIRPIHNESDLTWALAEIAQYFLNEPKPGTADADRFDVLSTLIEAYENKHWAISPTADPVDVILFVMAQTGRTQSDLAALLGSRSRASEILARKRELTKDQALKLHDAWRIPADILLRPFYRVA